jgi:hypothetical protein
MPHLHHRNERNPEIDLTLSKPTQNRHHAATGILKGCQTILRAGGCQIAKRTI